MLTKQQKTEEAEGERQKQVAITGESAKGRRKAEVAAAAAAAEVSL